MKELHNRSLNYSSTCFILLMQQQVVYVLFDPWKNVFVFSITLENTFEDSYYLKGDIMKALQNNINQKKPQKILGNTSSAQCLALRHPDKHFGIFGNFEFHGGSVRLLHDQFLPLIFFFHHFFTFPSLSLFFCSSTYSKSFFNVVLNKFDYVMCNY